MLDPVPVSFVRNIPQATDRKAIIAVGVSFFVSLMLAVSLLAIVGYLRHMHRR
ncbi:hypothetical protein [Paraburkholderia sp. MM5384-R2]|uniref:hypothetical protein n=1 Tax=Paraburkholderia sp. MM5384-R2 TaxID=2723097 RepID=UPI00161E0E32|nr:hypothetical protein [Paraburkholderia sp. MM5384-R2]MBB5500735.1 nitrate/nitrite-specific signal transduction histidine kinase [Paraburkholderia sp. MM5384-R2]